MSCEKDIVDIIAALATPIIALCVAIITFGNYRLAKRKRKDDLFDRRYKFYKAVERAWRNTGSGEPNIQPWWDWDDIEPWAHEAGFLFGPDISNHLRSYTDKGFEGISWLPDPDFAAPFEKYLSFEEETFLQKIKCRLKIKK